MKVTHPLTNILENGQKGKIALNPITNVSLLVNLLLVFLHIYNHNVPIILLNRFTQLLMLFPKTFKITYMQPHLKKIK